MTAKDKAAAKSKGGHTLTPKREAFAQAVASGMTQADAYRSAYSASKMKPETIQQAASRLMAISKVSARVAELREPIARMAQITLETHLQRLADLSEAAEQDGQFSAAITAEVARGKAAGIHIEKSEQLVTTREFSVTIKRAGTER